MLNFIAKFKQYYLFFLVICFFPATSQAQQYMFSYYKFYAQMKYNQSKAHPDVKLGFFFMDHQQKDALIPNNFCRIQKAWMEKEEHYEQLNDSDIELMIPLDKSLKEANPLVFIDLPKEKQCDISMVVMAKENKHQLTLSEVQDLTKQMDLLLNELNGMFGRWFAPNVIGLTLEFENLKQGTIQANSNLIPIKNGRAKLSLDMLKTLKADQEIKLPQQTFRILPLLSKKN